MKTQRYTVVPAAADAGVALPWELRCNGRVIARFSTQSAAIKTARLFVVIDQTAGKEAIFSETPDTPAQLGFRTPIFRRVGPAYA